MRYSSGFIACLVASLPILCHGAERQWCNSEDFDYDSAHPMSATRLLPTVGDDLLAEDWREVNQELVQAFREYVFDESLDQTDDNLQLFSDELDAYLGYDELRLEYMRARFNDATNQLSYEFEADQRTGVPSSLFLECSELSTDREGQAIAYFSDTLYEYGREGQASAVKLAAGIVGDIYSTHRNRLFNGLPMWPQETWLNGLGTDFEGNEPTLASRRQWILLRPSIAPALRFDGTENSELDAALVVELFGLVKYRRGSEFRKWQGLSGIATMTGDNGIGYGAMYRYNNWILGAAHHDRTDDWLLYVSVDLYKLVVPQDRYTNQANEFLSHLADHLKGEAAKTLDEAGGVEP